MTIAPPTRLTSVTDFLDDLDALTPVIRAAVAENEQAACVSPELISSMIARGYYDILLPAELGGLDIAPYAAMPIFDKLFSIDASTGWVVCVGNTHAKELNLLELDVALSMVTDRAPVTAGQAAPTGVAEIVDGGYRVTGKWGFASGYAYADTVIGAAFVTKDGEKQRNADGSPQVIFLFAPKAEAVELGGWHVLGLKGTGSVDYALTDVFIPARYTAAGGNMAKMKWGGAAALMSFTGWLVYAHTVTEMGLGRRLFEEVDAYAVTPNPRGRLADSELFRRQYGELRSDYAAARAFIEAVWRDIDATTGQGEAVSRRQHTDARAALLTMSRVNKRVANWIFEEAGSRSLRDGVLQQVIRDVKTSGNHNHVGRKFYNDITRDYLGEADGMIWTPNMLVPAPEEVSR
jgi:indole-3-acetate monooxygenase